MTEKTLYLFLKRDKKYLKSLGRAGDIILRTMSEEGTWVAAQVLSNKILVWDWDKPSLRTKLFERLKKLDEDIETTEEKLSSAGYSKPQFLIDDDDDDEYQSQLELGWYKDELRDTLKALKYERSNHIQKMERELGYNPDNLCKTKGGKNVH
jgi:hypothetical protein